jgi:hypothetical protein
MERWDRGTPDTDVMIHASRKRSGQVGCKGGELCRCELVRFRLVAQTCLAPRVEPRPLVGG